MSTLFICRHGLYILIKLIYINISVTIQTFLSTKVRYEDFASPLPTCQSLFRFIHDKNNTAYTEAEIEVCQKHFTNRSKSFDNLNGDNDGYTKNDQQPESRKELLSSSNRQGLKGHSPGVVKPPITNPTELPSAINLSSNIQHTQDMNEKNVTSSIPDIHKSSTLGRLAGYQAAYKVLTPETKRELDSISRLLKFFGYSLEENNELWDNKSISALDRWVLKPDS